MNCDCDPFFMEVLGSLPTVHFLLTKFGINMFSLFFLLFGLKIIININYQVQSQLKSKLIQPQPSKLDMSGKK